MAKQRKSKRRQPYVMADPEEGEEDQSNDETEGGGEGGEISDHDGSDYVPEEAEEDEDEDPGCTTFDAASGDEGLEERCESHPSLYSKEGVNFCNGKPVEVPSIKGSEFEAFKEFMQFFKKYCNETYQVKIRQIFFYCFVY